jgi:hypothetical protein
MWVCVRASFQANSLFDHRDMPGGEIVIFLRSQTEIKVGEEVLVEYEPSTGGGRSETSKRGGGGNGHKKGGVDGMVAATESAAVQGGGEAAEEEGGEYWSRQSSRGHWGRVAQVSTASSV